MTDALPVPLRQALQLTLLAGRGPLAFHLALVVLQGLLPLAGLFAMQWLVDAVAAGAQGRLPTADAFTAVWQATLFAAVVAVCGNIVRSLGAVVAETHGRRLADACAASLQEHAARLDLAAYDRPAFHDLLHRAGTESSHRPVRLVQDLAGLGTALVSLLAMGTVLALVEPWLPCVVAAAAVPIALARRRHARLRFAWQERHANDQRDIGYLGALLTGRATAKDVRALGLLPMLAARLAGLRASVRRSLQQLAVRRARDELLVLTIASLAMFGAYLYLGHLALAGGLSIGGLVLHAQAVQRAQNGVRDLLGGIAAVAEDRLFLRPFGTFLGLQPAVAAVPPVADPPTGPVRIDARGLDFVYPESREPALRGLHFTIEPGERIAVVGANGSGKSTLVKLLCRLYDPTAGALLAAGTDLRHTTPDAWRAQLAVLFQDAHAFELPLRDNLRLGQGRPGQAAPATDDELWRALRSVGLEARVRALPLQLDTPLSRRHAGGVEWSGGELRRLLLARALAQPAATLLLDEPFALLDGAAAEQLVAELRTRPREQTVVLVDHRSVALRAVDRVLLLDAGELVASGTPMALARSEPRFRALFPDA